MIEKEKIQDVPKVITEKKPVVRSGFQAKFYEFSLPVTNETKSDSKAPEFSEGGGEWKHAYSCELRMHKDIALRGAPP